MSTLSPLFAEETKHRSIRRLDSKELELKDDDITPKQIVFFEYFCIDDIKINFRFDSKPGFLNHSELTGGLKLAFVTMMNMKGVKFDFQCYFLNHASFSLPSFANNIKRHYISELYSQKQITSILMSIGIFGTLSETLSNLSTAFQLLIRNPNRHGNIIFGVGENLYNSARYTLYATSNTLTEVIGRASQLSAYVYLLGHKAYTTVLGRQTDLLLNLEDKETDENDIKNEVLHNINSLAASLDSQNKIWLAVVVSETITIQKQDKAVEPSNEEDKANDQQEPNQSQNSNPNVIKIIKRSRKAPTHDKKKGTGIKDVPLNIVSGAYSILKSANNYIRVDESTTTDRRIRFPRYFSYTKELEPYSAQKAYAVQIVDKSEHFVSFHTLKDTEVIFTKNQVLCLTLDDEMHNMKYWSLPFNDILSVQLSIEETKAAKAPEDSKTKSGEKKRGKRARDTVDPDIDVAAGGSKGEPISNSKQYIITVLHFNEKPSYDIQGNVYKNTGLVDFRVEQKLIIGNESEQAQMESICEELKNVVEKYKNKS